MGVARNGDARALRDGGADLVISDFDAWRGWEAKLRSKPVFAHWPEIRRRVHDVPLVLFLDFDGTLSPIVPHHEDAALAHGMHKILQRLAK